MTRFLLICAILIAQLILDLNAQNELTVSSFSTLKPKKRSSKKIAKKPLHRKSYSLNDHLNSPRLIIPDSKNGLKEEIYSIHYYPFGTVLKVLNPALDINSYGFNGQFVDNDIYGSDNSYDFGARFYDPRIARFMKPDRLEIIYPSLSPYQYVNNNPINNIDINGDYIYIINNQDPIDVNDILDRKTNGIKAQKLAKMETAVVQFAGSYAGRVIWYYSLDNSKVHIYVYPEIQGKDPSKYTLTPIYVLKDGSTNNYSKSVNNFVKTVHDEDMEIVSYEDFKHSFYDEIVLARQTYETDMHQQVNDHRMSQDAPDIFQEFINSEFAEDELGALYNMVNQNQRIWENGEELEAWYEKAFRNYMAQVMNLRRKSIMEQANKEIDDFINELEGTSD